jgi:hypothetical protein
MGVPMAVTARALPLLMQHSAEHLRGYLALERRSGACPLGRPSRMECAQLTLFPFAGQLPPPRYIREQTLQLLQQLGALRVSGLCDRALLGGPGAAALSGMWVEKPCAWHLLSPSIYATLCECVVVEDANMRTHLQKLLMLAGAALSITAPDA